MCARGKNYFVCSLFAESEAKVFRFYYHEDFPSLLSFFSFFVDLSLARFLVRDILSRDGSRLSVIT